MGGFSETIRRVALQKLGKRVWKRKINLVDQFWKDVDKTIYELIQGGMGLVARKALYVNDAFWGLVTMVIKNASHY